MESKYVTGIFHNDLPIKVNVIEDEKTKIGRCSANGQLQDVPDSFDRNRYRSVPTTCVVRSWAKV